jgi:hypothetical protein
MAKFTLQNPKLDPGQPKEPEVDPEALEAFAAGARERGDEDEERPPWKRYDPQAKPKYNVSIRLNDHQLEMLRYLSETLDVSQQKILQKQLLPVLQRMAVEAFEARRSK